MTPDLPPALPVKRTSGLAIASLVLGCCVTLFGCLTGIPAVVCGILGLRQIGRNPGMDGKGMAIAGLILGGLSLVILPILAAIAIPTISGALNAAEQAKEIVQARQIGLMLKAYAEDHDGKFPDTLEVLLENKTQPGEEVDKMLYAEGGHEFKWILTPGLTTESPGNTVLLESNKSSGTGRRAGRAAYTVEGSAKWVRDDGKGYSEP